MQAADVPDTKTEDLYYPKADKRRKCSSVFLVMEVAVGTAAAGESREAER